MDPQRRNIVANIIFNEEADLIVQNIAINNALELAEPINAFGDAEGRRNIQKNENFYEITIPLYVDDLFKDHFRMSREAVEVSQ
jgi:hypothetical protein